MNTVEVVTSHVAPTSGMCLNIRYHAFKMRMAHYVPTLLSPFSNILWSVYLLSARKQCPVFNSYFVVLSEEFGMRDNLNS